MRAGEDFWVQIERKRRGEEAVTLILDSDLTSHSIRSDGAYMCVPCLQPAFCPECVCVSHVFIASPSSALSFLCALL